MRRLSTLALAAAFVGGSMVLAHAQAPVVNRGGRRRRFSRLVRICAKIRPFSRCLRIKAIYNRLGGCFFNPALDGVVYCNRSLGSCHPRPVQLT
jgi:hypothetical protein